jgi:hypothetical protein
MHRLCLCIAYRIPHFWVARGSAASAVAVSDPAPPAFCARFARGCRLETVHFVSGAHKGSGTGGAVQDFARSEETMLLRVAAAPGGQLPGVCVASL